MNPTAVLVAVMLLLGGIKRLTGTIEVKGEITQCGVLPPLPEEDYTDVKSLKKQPFVICFEIE